MNPYGRSKGKEKMRVFMLGWEFPPHISGGLGTACFGMTKGLDEIGVEVTFVLPTAVPVEGQSHVRLRTPLQIQAQAQSQKQSFAAFTPSQGTEFEDVVTQVFKHVSLHQVPAMLQPYGTQASYEQALKEFIAQQLKQSKGTTMPVGLEKLQSAIEQARTAEVASTNGAAGQYGGDLITQVNKYASIAVALARTEPFDVIHAHDWMTYPAALAVQAATGKPLVVHVHSTEFDRSGEHVDQKIYDIERAGMQKADTVVCVSHLTRNIAVSRYGVDPDKVEVVYNAVALPQLGEWHVSPIKSDEKIVLFLGRMTMQKGPEYFLRAAKKVVEKFPTVRFVMAGSGDMMNQVIEQAATLGIGRYVTFTGFLRGKDVDRVFSMADLYVMPSVSEPFGIAPLEALSRNVPVIISKQSGVSEVINHALKVDFWDVDEMANKILAVLRHPPLQRTLRQHGQIELRKLSWKDSAVQLKSIYEKLSSPLPA